MVRALALAACLWAGVAFGGDAAPVVVSGAVHRGVVTEHGIAWESQIRGSSNGPGNIGRLSLAVPLPPEVEIRAEPPATPVWDAEGNVVALDVEGAVGTMTLRVWQPWDPGRLAPPLTAGDAVQRVTLDGATFSPAPALGLERHLRHVRQPGIRPRDRRWVDRAMTGRRARVREQPLYLVADARLREAGGLVGDVRSSGSAEPGANGFVLGLFAFTLVALSLAYRLLARRVRWERADAYIRAEFVGPEDAPSE